jgi:hypothetical protein
MYALEALLFNKYQIISIKYGRCRSTVNSAPQRKQQFLLLLRASPLLRNVLPLLTSLAHSVHVTLYKLNLIIFDRAP